MYPITRCCVLNIFFGVFKNSYCTNLKDVLYYTKDVLKMLCIRLKDVVYSNKDVVYSTKRCCVKKKKLIEISVYYLLHMY